jgi:hypothetical protein
MNQAHLFLEKADEAKGLREALDALKSLVNPNLGRSPRTGIFPPPPTERLRHPPMGILPCAIIRKLSGKPGFAYKGIPDV